MASKDDRKTELVFARVEKGLKKRVKQEAKDRRVDQSDVVRDALEEHFGMKPRANPGDGNGVL
jgi:hypothetical protein